VTADDILNRLAELEKRDGELGAAVEHLRDALIVSAAIQDRMEREQQAEAEDLTNLRRFTIQGLRLHEQRLNEVTERLGSLADLLADGFTRHQQSVAEHEQRMQQIELKLSEITGKLDALIDVVDRIQRQKRPPEDPAEDPGNP
jgi:hypothetical protein